MSIWTQITGSFYIHDYRYGVYDADKRLKSFMRDNLHRLPKGSERCFDFGIKRAFYSTGAYTTEDGEYIEKYGAGQLHFFGSLRDTCINEAVSKIVDFIKILRSAFQVRIGQVFLIDGMESCCIQVEEDSEIKIKIKNLYEENKNHD